MEKDSKSWFSLEKILWVLWVIVILISMPIYSNSLHNLISAFNGMLGTALVGCAITFVTNLFRHKRYLSDRYFWLFLFFLVLHSFIQLVLQHV